MIVQDDLYLFIFGAEKVRSCYIFDQARAGRILDCSVSDGIMKLMFDCEDNAYFRHWPSTKSRVSVPHKLPDPYESRFVTPGNSNFGSEAGDGLFLKVGVKAGTTVSFYNGIRIPAGERSPVDDSSYQIYLDWTVSKVIRRVDAF